MLLVLLGPVAQAAQSYGLAQGLQKEDRNIQTLLGEVLLLHICSISLSEFWTSSVPLQEII